MFGIVGGLLGGWILGLFGFDGVVIEGMAQLFGVTIDKTGYYFMFGAMGALVNIFGRRTSIKEVNQIFKDKDKSKK